MMEWPETVQAFDREWYLDYKFEDVDKANYATEGFDGVLHLRRSQLPDTVHYFTAMLFNDGFPSTIDEAIEAIEKEVFIKVST